MDITNFLTIGIVGSGLSLLIEYLKNRLQLDALGTKIMVVIFSVVLGTAYFFLQGTVAWQAILGILAASSTFYAFFLK